MLTKGIHVVMCVTSIYLCIYFTHVLTIDSRNIIVISNSPDKEKNDIPKSDASPHPPPIVFLHKMIFN